MNRIHPRPTLDRLNHLLAYDRETGVFTWRVDRTCGHGRVVCAAGTVAGTFWPAHGITISIDGKQFKANILAWFMTTGAWPLGMVDHRDGNKRNNSFLNLRDVSGKVNTQNQRKASSRNKSSGLLGVSANKQGRKKPWKAQIQVDRRIKYLGAYETKEQAHEAYVKAKRVLHEGCTI